MKNDRVIALLGLATLIVAILIDGPLKYVSLGFSITAFLIFVLKAINRNKTT